MEGKKRKITLEAEGWVERFAASEPRLSEAVEIYRECGFEVHLEPLPKEAECENCSGDSGDNKCHICFDGFEDQYRIIYTRPAKDPVKRKEVFLDRPDSKTL